MTGKVKKLLDIFTFGLYNIRINKHNQGEKIMADATAKNYTDEMVEQMVVERMVVGRVVERMVVGRMVIG